MVCNLLAQPLYLLFCHFRGFGELCEIFPITMFDCIATVAKNYLQISTEDIPKSCPHYIYHIVSVICNCQNDFPNEESIHSRVVSCAWTLVGAWLLQKAKDNRREVSIVNPYSTLSTPQGTPSAIWCVQTHQTRCICCTFSSSDFNMGEFIFSRLYFWLLKSTKLFLFC